MIAINTNNEKKKEFKILNMPFFVVRVKTTVFPHQDRNIYI